MKLCLIVHSCESLGKKIGVYIDINWCGSDELEVDIGVIGHVQNEGGE